MLSSLLCFRRYFASKMYAKSHEWVLLLPDRKVARVGITNYAQEQLGEIIHIEFPSLGTTFEAGDNALVIQSVKLAADVATPIEGTVLATNTDIQKTPGLVNEDAENAWLLQIKYEEEPLNMLTEEQYLKEIKG